MDSKPSEFYRSGAVLQTKMGMAVVCHRAGGYPTCENRKGRGSLSWAVQKSGPPRVKSLRKAEQARRVDRDCERAAIYGRVDWDREERALLRPVDLEFRQRFAVRLYRATVPPRPG
jgi:hypothetical protein